MFFKLIIHSLGCLLVTVRTEDECKSWKNHKNFHLLPSEDVCGRVKVNQMFRARILNGITAKAGSLPWMANIIVRNGKQTNRCGGSVINDNFILTAAHCLDGMDNPTVTVYLGVHSTAVDSGSVEKYNMSGYILHPGYEETSMKNDIALIRLDRSINFESRYINSICLPTSCDLANNKYIGEKLKIAGWGYVSNGIFATTLQSADVPVKKCRRYELDGDEYFPPSDSQLCAGRYDVIACGGDSGGPLAHKTAERFVQVGVLSFGPTDCQKSSRDQADFYTRVASFMRWILDNIDN